MIDQYSVDGKNCIITGASSGIGRSIAERFADEGANVTICSREQANVDPVAESIQEAGGTAVAIECDVTDRSAVEGLVETTVEEFSGIDVLVNNAGASFMANFDDISPNGWQTIVDINLTGTYNCTQIAGNHLKETKGSVINLASVAGQRGSPYMTHYGAAKAGIINLTTSLAFEWAGQGVRINCIAPGFVATPGVESQMGVSADEIDRTEVDRRVGEPQEIADIAQFLASPASSYIVGETITARGVPPVMENPDV